MESLLWERNNMRVRINSWRVEVTLGLQLNEDEA